MTAEVIVTSLDSYAAGWSEWPRPVALFASHAEGHGWAVRVGYSHGYVDGKRVEMIGAWLDGFGHRAVAHWVRNPDSQAATGPKWAARSTAIWCGYGRVPFPYASHTEIREWLGHHGLVPVEWFDRIRARVTARAERTTTRAPVARTAREHGG
jgi:hypothetical protein